VSVIKLLDTQVYFVRISYPHEIVKMEHVE